MTTRKSGPKAIQSITQEKNGRRIWLISHATAPTHTWATPRLDSKITLSSKEESL